MRTVGELKRLLAMFRDDMVIGSPSWALSLPHHTVEMDSKAPGPFLALYFGDLRSSYASRGVITPLDADMAPPAPPPVPPAMRDCDCRWSLSDRPNGALSGTLTGCRRAIYGSIPPDTRCNGGAALVASMADKIAEEWRGEAWP